MEAAGGAGEPEALTCFSYNQDCTSLAIGTKTGYKLFSLSSVEQLDQVHESNEIPDVYIVERLFSSSLVVVVSRSKPRQMNVYHFKKGTEICNYSYSSDILSIRLNRQRLIVCLEESIYIHNIKDMKLLKTILDTPLNSTGLCALSINHSNSYLAYPGSTTVGEIVLYDGNNLRDVCSISAHDGPLAALAFNSTGSKLASASEKGTVFRVFSIPEGQKLYEFRRGVKRYVNISSLVFSMDSQFLCASSNTETVHIFKLEHLTDSRPEEPPSWSGYMGRMFMAATNYLPSQVSGMMIQDRAFATVRLNISGPRNICALSTIQKLPRLLVTTSDGHLYLYNLDPQDGGECVLIKKHRLLDLGKTEENKENDLRPPAAQTYAATVAKQSSVPSPSMMPDNLMPWNPDEQSEEFMRSGKQQSTERRMGGSFEKTKGECRRTHNLGGTLRCSSPFNTVCSFLASSFWPFVCAFLKVLCKFGIHVLYIYVALYSRTMMQLLP
ncbi:WD repeat domain phosphoinositide-interacting protein 1 isoform X1 [Varanus komodoensis]|uniref:WD repeat domain, phosphoinositide interacting 1 n=1 Tax=Varanus komodoensis TaxID=61221 RepID=A0A8D2JAV3_VARKO|nr:WD repeat domain phosphoinositide-interacting protein 1 isoform X1 [Varanus komodoensis]